MTSVLQVFNSYLLDVNIIANLVFYYLCNVENPGDSGHLVDDYGFQRLFHGTCRISCIDFNVPPRQAISHILLSTCALTQIYLL